MSNKTLAKPFLKWAGGKTQLLPAIAATLPDGLTDGPFTYVEPFVGSGAVFFWFVRNFPSLQKAVINDINADLIQTYSVIKEEPDSLIRSLANLQREYYKLETAAQKSLFLHIRDLFNSRTASRVEQSAYTIFLNRTCFNGLFRVNAQNKFNVPFGRYSNPAILDEENIRNVSAALQNVYITNTGYEKTVEAINSEDKVFYYLDPPYKPLSATASFKAYASDAFNDSEQQTLKEFCDKLTAAGMDWLLSNSDPKNTDPSNHFFDDLYKEYHIDRVRARRMINSDATKRGEIFELLIHNYGQKQS